MTKNERLTKYETLERLYCNKAFNTFSKNVIISDIEYSKILSAEHYDVTFSYKNQKYLGEIKCRECFYETYPDFIFQRDKFDCMMKHTEIDNFYYINFFNRDEKHKDFVFFNITSRINELNQDKSWQIRWLQKSEFDKTLEQKFVTYLKYDKKYGDLKYFINL